MDMILLDWTRMGHQYCLAGVVPEGKQYRVVRPLLRRPHQDAPSPLAGWSAWLLDGHSRWEVFELIAPEPAEREPPHREDVWVRSLRSRRCLASREQRQAILTATMIPPGETLFGVHLIGLRKVAYLRPGTGVRSLATLPVSSRQITFHASCREGAPEPDVRVTLHLAGLESRLLPVKDHHLLLRAQQVGDDPRRKADFLTECIHGMGDLVAVRLGLTRPFPPRDDGSRGFCWLMADGFFSLSDPQP